MKVKVTTEDPELANRFDRILGDAVEALEESSIRYAFIGGIASGGLGRPRSTHDIDIFVRPEDAELALRALAKRGFKTEKTDPSWLYKGFKENILVDVIFKSKGEIYLDSEMLQRLVTAQFHGRKLRLVSPEDLLIIKAAAHSELTPGHWHDAVALLSHSNLDWQYLLRRARRAPRRLLSLLLYAQSNDVWVPNQVIFELHNQVFGDHRPKPYQDQHEERVTHPQSHPQAQSHNPQHSTGEGLAMKPQLASLPEYRIAHCRERLAEDARTNELDIQIEQSGDTVLLRGEVSVPKRRESAEQIAREVFPDCKIENQIRILKVDSPKDTEEVQ